MLTSDFLMVKAMLSPSQALQYQKESVERALTCANCGQKLHVLEVHVCEHC
ncbi:TPA: protein NinF, partial [Salmonella enterica subsp. enterica serovar Java]